MKEFKEGGGECKTRIKEMFRLVGIICNMCIEIQSKNFGGLIPGSKGPVSTGKYSTYY